MHNFKKVVLLCAIFLLFESFIGFALEPVTFQHYLDIELEKKAEENIQPDLAFFGNSRISTSFIPNIFNNHIDTIDLSFNGGTGSQGIAGTYYYLKDTLKKYDLKYAVVGIDYQTILKEERNLKKDLVVLERLKNPFVKMEFITDVFNSSEYIYFLKSYQYRNNFEDVMDNLKLKLSKEYRQGIYTGEGMVYENLGFTRETSVFGNHAGIYLSQPWEEENIDWDKMEYLDRIIELCKKENVQLFLVSTPLTISTVYATPGYGECVEFFTTYAKNKNVPYDNLNLLKGREEFLPDSIMNSMEHVGNEGADIISEYYCNILKDRIEGKEVGDYFHLSLEDMKNHMQDIVACQLRTEAVDESGNRRIFASFLGKDSVKPEYQFEVEKEGKVEVLQEFSRLESVPLPIDKISYPMILRVRVRGISEHEKIYEVQIDEQTWK